ncbi:MAG: hypothetical protein R3D33_11220 [Hyphomicrobiaceae bacterium]
MLSTIGRMIWVAIAFLVAAGVAAFVVVTLGAERLAEEVHRQSTGGDIDLWLGYADQVMGIFDIVTALSLVPGLVAVVVGEVARLRSLLYWTVAGGVALVAVPVIGRLASEGNAVLPPTTLLQVLATAGFAAGFVYWALAGRSA